MTTFNSDGFTINNNFINYSYYEKNIINYFKDNYDIYFYWGFSSDLGTLLDLIKNNVSNKKYLIFFVNDYNDVIIDNIPDNFIIFRSGMYKSMKKYNEYVLPIIYCNNINYSLVYYIEPVEKTSKPKVCFSGGSHTYYLRETWLNYLISSTILDCNIVDKGCFRGGTTYELIDNYKTSEFCFCPRGSGNFSIRFYETLYYGRIPVLIDTDILLPFANQIEWEKYIVISNNIEELPEKIYDFWLNNDIYQLQIECKNLYTKYFTNENIAKHINNEILVN